MARNRRRVRLRGKFFLVVGGAAALLIVALVVILGGNHADEVQFGSLSADLEVSAAVIRDEAIVSTEKYEKINFNVIEGQAVANGTQVAKVFKRGYQDESMISLLNQEKEIRSYQLNKLGTDGQAGLQDIDTRILALEKLIRNTAREDGEQDVLELEQQLKTLQQERIAYLRANTPVDTNLQSLYDVELNQQQSMTNWTRDIINNVGDGIISFYFDGYEQALSVSKLNTINAALVNSVVRGNNTASKVESSTEQLLYRLVFPNHWYIAFTTRVDDPMRLTAGEAYYVSFPDYSSALYQAVAREAIASTDGVVNVLEFNVDIGSFIGIRTVKAMVSKSAQGLMIERDYIATNAGVPCVYVKNGDASFPVELEVLAEDDKRAIVRPKDGSNVLVTGQKLAKPPEQDENG